MRHSGHFQEISSTCDATKTPCVCHLNCLNMSDNYDDIFAILGIAAENTPVSHPKNTSMCADEAHPRVDVVDGMSDLDSDAEDIEMWLNDEFPLTHVPDAADVEQPPARAPELPATNMRWGDNNSALCFCGGHGCQKPYKRHLRHPRVLEQSSQLERYVGGVKYRNVQIAVPAELQACIGYGSCGRVFESLKLFMKFLQLELGWRPQSRSGGYKCRLPSVDDYMKARTVLLSLPVDPRFYSEQWVPTFHIRFVEACGGMKLLQNCTQRFFFAEDLGLLY